MSDLWETIPAPTAVGGTGGSGTRVVTELLSCGGVFMGAELNRAGDALPLAEFDWTWGKPYLEAELAGASAPLAPMRAALQHSLRAHLGDETTPSGPWGWKHTHAYLLLPWLDSVIPDLRFIHFVRDGRRMAFSRNQKQPQHYGDAVFGEAAREWAPHVLAIEFWGWANERAADYGEQHMRGRYVLARFEDVCSEPQRMCRELIEFAREDADVSAVQVSQAAQLVSEPPAPELDAELLAEVESLGSRSLGRFGYL